MSNAYDRPVGRGNIGATDQGAGEKDERYLTEGERKRFLETRKANDPFILAGMYEAAWNRRLEDVPDARRVLDEINKRIGRQVRGELRSGEQGAVDRATRAYLSGNWVSYKESEKESPKPYRQRNTVLDRCILGDSEYKDLSVNELCLKTDSQIRSFYER
jgi:hypothetical protein